MIKLIVDCTCEMGSAEAEKMGIISMPMRMLIDDQEYLAGKNLDNDTFYQLLPNAKTAPKTMQINDIFKNGENSNRTSHPSHPLMSCLFILVVIVCRLL